LAAASWRISPGLRSRFDDWLLKERRRLLSIARMAGEAFFEERHSGEENHHAARSLIGLEPAHGGAWRALAQAHLDNGDRCRRALRCDQWREALGRYRATHSR